MNTDENVESCRYCGDRIYIWQETWVHQPDGRRYCYDTAAEPIDS